MYDEHPGLDDVREWQQRYIDSMPSHRARRGPGLQTVRLLLSLVVAAVLLPPVADAAEKGIETDLTWGVSNVERARAVTDVQELGAKWMRLTMAWHGIETGKDSYSLLRHYDDAIAKAATSDARIVVTVYTAPSWASGVADPESPPLDPADYADFMRFAAARWGQYVDAWEVWNEPNLRDFWSTGPNASRYAQLLRAAYPAVKGADPTAAVVFGGVAYNDYRFISAAYAAVPNLGDYYDVMATHPYPRPANAPPDRVWLESDGRIAVKAFAGYREVRKVMLAHGDDKPLWFTEFGWSTNTVDGWGVTESQQAAYLEQALRCIEQDPYVQVAIWYLHRNHAWAADANTWADQLGLVRTDFSRKPAFDAFKQYTPGNGGCTYDIPSPAEPPAAPVDMPSTPIGPVAGSMLERTSPRLSVRRARIVDGELVVDGRVARGATGRVSVVTVYDGLQRAFRTRVRADGTIRIRRRLQGGARTLLASVALVYEAPERFHRQWVVLQAAARGPRLRLRRDGSRPAAISGTLVPNARGSVVLGLYYRASDGRARAKLSRSRIRRGTFRHLLAIPHGARDATLYVVYTGDPERGIGGSSATLAVR
jgi:polysaccharide biosynthesis protein PslG